MHATDTTKHFEDVLKDALEETGAELGVSAHDLALYMTERSLHLSTIAHEPGFDQALRAERNNVALRAGLELDDNATTFDAQIIGIIQGGLALAAAALA